MWNTCAADLDQRTEARPTSGDDARAGRKSDHAHLTSVLIFRRYDTAESAKSLCQNAQIEVEAEMIADLLESVEVFDERGAAAVIGQVKID